MNFTAMNGCNRAKVLYHTLHVAKQYTGISQKNITDTTSSFAFVFGLLNCIVTNLVFITTYSSGLLYFYFVHASFSWKGVILRRDKVSINAFIDEHYLACYLATPVDDCACTVHVSR